MDSYLVVKNGSQAESYELRTSEPSKPYLKVNSSYIGLTTETDTTWGLRIKPGVTSYNIQEIQTDTTIQLDYNGYSGICSSTGTKCYVGYMEGTITTGYSFRSGYIADVTEGAFTFSKTINGLCGTWKFSSTATTTNEYYDGGYKTINLPGYLGTEIVYKSDRYTNINYRIHSPDTSTSYEGGVFTTDEPCIISNVDYDRMSFNLYKTAPSIYKLEEETLFYQTYKVYSTREPVYTSSTYLPLFYTGPITYLTSTVGGPISSHETNNSMSSTSCITGDVLLTKVDIDYRNIDYNIDNVTSTKQDILYNTFSSSNTCVSSCIFAPRELNNVVMYSTSVEGYGGYRRVDYNDNVVDYYKGVKTINSETKAVTDSISIIDIAVSSYGTVTSNSEPSYSYSKNAAGTEFYYSGDTSSIRVYTCEATGRKIQKTSESTGFIGGTYYFGSVGNTFKSTLTRSCTGNYREIAGLYYPDLSYNMIGGTTVDWNNYKASIEGFLGKPSFTETLCYDYNISNSNSVSESKYLITTYFQGISRIYQRTNTWTSYYKTFGSKLISTMSVTTTNYKNTSTVSSSDSVYFGGYGIYGTHGFITLSDMTIISKEINTSSYRRVAQSNTQNLVSTYPLYKTVTYTTQI